MLFGFNLELWLPGLILLIGGIDDLRSKKIHNRLILFLLPFVLAAVVFLKGPAALYPAGFSALLAFLIGAPLALSRFIGGGDLKLLILFAAAAGWPVLIHVLIYSVFWALALGLIKIALDRKLKEFFFNLLFLFRHRSSQGLNLHSIPYSIALFMAWLSFITLRGADFKGLYIFPI